MGFSPRILGVLLIAAGCGYLAESLTSLLLPSCEHVVGRITDIPLTLGEPATILWLLIRGAKVGSRTIECIELRALASLTGDEHVAEAECHRPG